MIERNKPKGRNREKEFSLVWTREKSFARIKTSVARVPLREWAATRLI